MCRFISRFRKSPLLALVVWGGFWLEMGCSSSSAGSLLSPDGYLIVTEDRPAIKDTRWATYLYDHLKTRTPDKTLFALGESSRDMLVVTVRLDTALDCDYKVERNETGVKLTARDDEKMLWLQYQLMKRLGEYDARIETSDLPPSVLSMRDTCGTFAFEYRGMYTPATCDSDYASILGVDNADAGWGIWGHNLGKVVGGDPSGNMYAEVCGTRNEEQFCFSSDTLYQRLERCISDRYGSGETGGTRFVIAPNDNSFVCGCSDCQAAGNTSENAGPAVTKLIVRLAKRFPGHTFFTLAYGTVREVPDVRLPANTGVIVSALDFPFRYGGGGLPEGPFARMLERWKERTNRVYVWDYINNFDDYLTPFPVLRIMQQRLQAYRACGVNGVFLNGSGYDYSSFDDVKSFVLSALAVDPDRSVDELAYRFFAQNYPASKAILYRFYSALEERAAADGKTLNLYGGIGDAERAFLDVSAFAAFYDELEKTLPSANGVERKKLNELLSAFAFTRLETARANGGGRYGWAVREGNLLRPVTEVETWLDRLGVSGDFVGMQRYRESGGDIGDYVGNWRRYILEASAGPDLLLGKAPFPVSPLDEGYTDLSPLTDGTRGFPDNYHCGWVVSSRGDFEVELPVGEAGEARTFRMTFLNDPRHKIYPPLEVQLFRDGKPYKTLRTKPSVSDAGPSAVVAEGTVELGGVQKLSVKAIRPEGAKALIAVDEILLIP